MMTIPAMTETLYDFPLLVRISTTAGVNDYDLTSYTDFVILDNSNNELPTERVGNNIWVRTTLHTYPTTFYIVDGTPSNNSVWDFATMVLHLSSLKDSVTGNMLTGSTYTQLPESVSLSSSSRITTTNTIPLTGDCGFTSVVKFKASSLSGSHTLGTWGVNGTGTEFSPMVTSTFVSAEFGGSNYSCNHTLALNTYYTLVTIKTPGPINTTTTLILDGNILALTSTYTNIPNISASTFSLGGWKPDSSYRFIGEIQESWILPAKSVAYCQALYLSIEDSLITYG
jgi:hypothetical protein